MNDNLVRELYEYTNGRFSEDWLRQWVQRSNHSLGWKKPIDYVVDTVTLNTVRKILNQIESGTYA